MNFFRYAAAFLNLKGLNFTEHWAENCHVKYLRHELDKLYNAKLYLSIIN